MLELSTIRASDRRGCYEYGACRNPDEETMKTVLNDPLRASGQARLDAEAGYKAFSAYAEISRKWVSVMDTKAGFVAALNLGLLGFLWTGAKLSEVQGLVRWLAMSATVFSLVSVVSAIWVAMPRETLRQIFGRKMRWDPENKPVSFYGFVASEYGASDFERYRSYVTGLDMADLAQEALKQHFVICHSIARKSQYVKTAGLFLLAALACVGVALAFRVWDQPVPVAQPATPLPVTSKTVPPARASADDTLT